MSSMFVKNKSNISSTVLSFSLHINSAVLSYVVQSVSLGRTRIKIQRKLKEKATYKMEIKECNVLTLISTSKEHITEKCLVCTCMHMKTRECSLTAALQISGNEENKIISPLFTLPLSSAKGSACGFVCDSLLSLFTLCLSTNST